MSDDIQIAILKQKLHVAKEQHDEAAKLYHVTRDAVRSASEELDKALWGVAPGVLVIGTSGSQTGGIYLVHSIDLRLRSHERRPWVVAHRRKKDGTFEARQVSLFSDWELHANPAG